MTVPFGPLTGFVVGVTADRRSGEQIELLTRKGAAVVHGPTIKTHPLAPEHALAEATRALIARPPDLTVLTTGIGVRGWLEAAESLALADDLLESLQQSTILTRGKKAYGAAMTAGLNPAWQTPDGTCREMLDELRRRDVAGLRIAIQLDGAERATLAELVAALGSEVVAVPVYQWTLPVHPEPALRLVAAVVERRIDAITFTSRPQIENLCALAERSGQLDDLRSAVASDTTVACVGPVCAATAADLGCVDLVVPQRYRLGSMVQALAAAFEQRAMKMTLGGVPIRVQGRAAMVGDQVVALTHSEAVILRGLAMPFGAVVSKSRLLERMSSCGQPDEHSVEVVVARLRRRLGPAGAGIETVIRRGYRLSAA